MIRAQAGMSLPEPLTRLFIGETSMPTPTITKRCCSCKTSKSLAAFHKNKATQDGHQNYCKAC